MPEDLQDIPGHRRTLSHPRLAVLQNMGRAASGDSSADQMVGPSFHSDHSLENPGGRGRVPAVASRSLSVVAPRVSRATARRNAVRPCLLSLAQRKNNKVLSDHGLPGKGLQGTGAPI